MGVVFYFCTHVRPTRMIVAVGPVVVGRRRCQDGGGEQGCVRGGGRENNGAVCKKKKRRLHVCVRLGDDEVLSSREMGTRR